MLIQHRYFKFKNEVIYFYISTMQQLKHRESRRHCHDIEVVSIKFCIKVRCTALFALRLKVNVARRKWLQPIGIIVWHARVAVPTIGRRIHLLLWRECFHCRFTGQPPERPRLCATVVKEARCCRWAPAPYASNFQQVADGVCSRVQARVHGANFRRGQCRLLPGSVAGETHAARNTTRRWRSVHLPTG